MSVQSSNTRHSQESGVGLGGVFVTAPREREGTVEVVCSSARRRMDHATSKTFRLFSHTLTVDPTPFPEWPSHTELHCWNCCHQFDTVPISIPQTSVNVNAKKHYSVYGVFCSINCAKKYLMDKHTHDRPQLLMTLNELCVDVYGMCADKVFNAIAAPPRMCLSMFGGDMDIEAYREESLTTHTVLVTPPFVSHAMITEKYPISQDTACPDPATAPPTTTKQPSSSEVVIEPLQEGKHVLRGLRRPTHPLVAPAEDRQDVARLSRFEDFVNTKNVEEESGTTKTGNRSRPLPAARPAKRVRRKEREGDGGGMGGGGGGLTSFLTSRTRES